MCLRMKSAFSSGGVYINLSLKSALFRLFRFCHNGFFRAADDAAAQSAANQKRIEVMIAIVKVALALAQFLSSHSVSSPWLVAAPLQRMVVLSLRRVCGKLFVSSPLALITGPRMIIHNYF